MYVPEKSDIKIPVDDYLLNHYANIELALHAHTSNHLLRTNVAYNLERFLSV